MRRLALLTAAVLAASIGFVSAAPQASASTTKRCYKAADDADGDGYARAGATAEYPTVSSSSLNCPSGYVQLAGDCNDGSDLVWMRRLIHPRRAEVAFNGVDDDCDGPNDEAEPLYSAAGNGNGTGSFGLTVRVNTDAVRDLGSEIYGRVQVSSLEDSSSLALQPRQKLTVYASRYASSPPTARAVVAGLSPNTAYRARIFFYNSSGVAVGIASEWYYTTTTGPSELDRDRTSVALQAFNELEESNAGRVGYLGTSQVAGTRYGASSNEKWCSEFYVWSAKNWVSGISGADSVDEVVSYFNNRYSYYASPSAIAAYGDPGDYVAMDTNDDGKKNHSGMFLAVETTASGQRVWTLEGNTSNTVGIRIRELGTEVKGLGNIKSSMV